MPVGERRKSKSHSRKNTKERNMNSGNTTQRKRRWLIGIPAGIILLIVVISRSSRRW
jgi:hypothetical protein